MVQCVWPLIGLEHILHELNDVKASSAAHNVQFQVFNSDLFMTFPDFARSVKQIKFTSNVQHLICNELRQKLGMMFRHEDLIFMLGDFQFDS